ncbi:bacterial Ig-like domain-containing protein [Bacillus sp. MSP13]|uniref:bacterial Ig-like domain-containing protein n=1 Tax=Bacillus sp. MSP13 TaxID=1071061 RepID=UPI00057C340B|nr:bacterial Ig-like domain-containing protein [Bacillus sp. MSP13]
MKKPRFVKNIAMIAIFLMLFSNMNLTVFAQTFNNPLGDGWSFEAFGSNTSDGKNTAPTDNGDGSLTILAEGGKIASNEIGISFQSLELNASDNFEITTTVSADSYSPDKQRGFGLMILDQTGEDKDGKNRHNYVAVGALDGDLRGYYSKGGLTKLDVFPNSVSPATGESYNLSIKKSGDTFVVTSNGERETFKLEDAFSGDISVGLFVARNGQITFSNTTVDVSDVVTDELQANKDDIKTEDLGDKELRLEGLAATAVNGDHSEPPVAETRVTGYPRTTYTVGDAFNADGLEVSKIYDNGDQEVLNSDAYELDTSNFNHSIAGVYTIGVNPTDSSTDGTSFDVTVREEAEIVWNEIRFGHSTSDDTNYIEYLDNGGIRVVAEGTSAGKITGDHDGITFYYTEIDAKKDNFTLSADIKVNEYAKTSHDGQESFGIMARDAIGENGNSGVFASNIAAIGGFSGGTKEMNGTQLFIRTGVKSSDGTGSQGIQKTMLKAERPSIDNTHPAEDYRLTLSKTNSGYTGQLNHGDEAVFFEPEILDVQDDKIYVGFYTARLADIEVHHIDLEITASATDAPRVYPPTEPAEPVEPNFSIVSRDKTSEATYDLLMKSNVDGVLTVKAGQKVIASNLNVTKGEIVKVPATLKENADTNFSTTFLPSKNQYLTSYDKIVKNFTVSMKTFRDGEDIHVSPDGTRTGNGALANPLDLDTAIEYVQPGQRIIVADGNYVRDSKLEFSKYNDGTESSRKYLVAANGARPVIDFDKRSEGGILNGNYWHIKGIDVARSAANTKGFVVGGHHNIVEDSRFYENGDTGLQISRTDGDAPREEWPSNNLILNSESFDNADPAHNNADGFAAKLTSGEGNIFRGCISHHNIDDGYDLYTKVRSGAIGAVTIEDSIAYDNGTLTDGTVGDGDKNGFKLGGEGVHVPHIIRNSIAFNNGATGFTSNSNPGVITDGIIAYNNGKNIDFSTYSGIEEDFKLSGIVSYHSGVNATDTYPMDALSDDNYFFNGKESVNASSDVITDENFVSLDPELPYERDENIKGLKSNIIWGDFLQYLPTITAELEVRPATLKLNENKNSKAVLTSYLVFADETVLENIDFASLLLNGKVVPAEHQKKDPVVDFNNDGIAAYKIAFPRQQLLSTLEKGEQRVTVTGTLTTGQKFRATGIVTVK